MSGHANSAVRLSKILTSMPGIQDQERAYKGWGRVFGLDYEGEQLAVARAVGERLVLANKELLLLKAQLQQTTLSKVLYEAPIAGVAHALSPLLIGQQWTHVKQHVTEAHRVAFAYLAELLPIEEIEVTSEQLAELRQLALSMLEALDSPPVLPAQLDSLIRHHAEMILAALDDYDIVGVKALKRAQYVAWGEMREQEDEIVANNDSDAVTRLGKAWATVADVCDKVTKVGKFGVLVHDVYKLIHGGG